MPGDLKEPLRVSGAQRDDCKRVVSLPESRERVVSLCPSITETVAELAAQTLVGRTRYCIHPAGVIADIPTVGGTKNPNVDAIRGLQPDLIIAEKEENRQEDVLALQSVAPVWVFDIRTVANALRMIRQLGLLLHRRVAAEHLASGIEECWPQIPVGAKSERVLYLIWRKPWMAAAGGTYIDSVLGSLGLINVLGDQQRYPELTVSSLKTLKPDRVLLSSEPYPFNSTHQDELREVLPDAKIELVDGEAFSWYGSRMLASASLLMAMA